MFSDSGRLLGLGMVLFGFAVGCSESTSPTKAISGSDAGFGAGMDAGPRLDGGRPPADGGALDAQVVDAGEPDCLQAPLPTCTSSAAVYGFRSADAAPYCLGSVLACAEAATLGRLAVDLLVDDALAITSGYTSERIAYRTQRAPGVAGVGSATVFRPTVPSPAENAPLVVVTHGTAGLADDCAPSRGAGGDPGLILPWVGTGLFVVAVDYAGLGTEGVQGYGNAFDTGYSVIDGARAALAILELSPGRPIIVVGHSQGGGAALAAQGLASSYGADLNLVRVVSYAGGSAGAAALDPTLADLLPLFPIVDPLGSTRAVFSLSLYADFANLFGEDRAGEPFDPALRNKVVTSIESNCIFQLAADLNTATGNYTPPINIGQLTDDGFLTAAIACIKGESACTADARVWLDRRDLSTVALDPAGAQILYIGADGDTLHTPREYACNLDGFLRADAPVETCFVADTNHFNIVGRSNVAAYRWATGDGLICPPAAAAPACE